MIVGVGVDVASLDRFAAVSDATRNRILTPSEACGRLESQAGKFAAKEALAKALGAPAGLAWHDCQVVTAESGQPSFVLSGTVAARAAELGVARIHLSISHDAGVAVAMVVCEG